MFVAYLIPKRDLALLDEGLNAIATGTTRDEALAKLRAQFESDYEWEETLDWHFCFVHDETKLPEQA